jgi:hypothetical protein
MRTTRISAILLGLSLIVFFATTSARISGQGGAAPAIDNDDIGGVVTGAQGPEAGVWVIAETRSTPTHLVKSVVTDDRGRFVVPDLPSGEYDVWVRGYGLVDSPKVKSSPGKVVNLKAGSGAGQEGGGSVLSRSVLVLAAAGAAEDRFPWYG